MDWDWVSHILNSVKPIPAIEKPPAPKVQGPIYGSATPARIPGLVAQGNTDLSQLPIVRNPGGDYSTVYSTGFTDENPKSPYYNKEVLARGIVNGQKTDDINAVRNEYYKTGKHLGIFSTPEASDAYGQKLHDDWAAGLIPGVKMPTDPMQPVNVFGRVPSAGNK